jgi:hypothetical protein
MYYVNPTADHYARSDEQPTMTPPFLFASPDGRSSSSARRVHLRRLYDILQLSIQRGDLLLAQRSFALLSRCEDIEWAAIWKFGLIILAAADHPDQRPGYVNVNMLGTPKHIEFLRVMMLRHPEEVRTSLFDGFGWFRFLPFHFRRIPPGPQPSSQVSPTHHLSIGQRESLVRELVLSLAMAGRERDALDELELCGSLTFFCIHQHRL